jgi:hypothetical protein
MRGEMYVTLLIHRWERARQMATALYQPDQDIRSALNEAESAQLGDTFSRLADRLASGLVPRGPGRFTESHLRLLKDPQVMTILARVLDCGEGDALDLLMDPLPMRRALDEVSLSPARVGLTADLLVSELRTRATEIRRRRGFTENEWGDFLEAKRWIKRSAVLLMRQEAERRDWPADTPPARILAGIIDAAGQPELGPGPDSDEGTRYDALASTLQRQAESHFADAVQAAPSMRSLALLQGTFELYERQAVARGLSQLCGGTRVLATLLQDARTEDKGIDAAPKSDEYLTVKPELPYIKRRTLTSLKPREYVTFSVMCKIRSADVHMPILDVIALPVEDYHYVSEAICRLRGQELSAIGDTLGQRLLNTEVAVSKDFAGRLRATTLKNSALIAQTIVLCGIRQPAKAPIPWQNQLSDSLDYTVTDPDHDTRISNGRVADIVADLNAQYASRGVTPRNLS